MSRTCGFISEPCALFRSAPQSCDLQEWPLTEGTRTKCVPSGGVSVYLCSCL